MDPDANVRERIALLTQDRPIDSRDRARVRELRAAYSEWIARGGFPAAPDLLAALTVAAFFWRRP